MITFLLCASYVQISFSQIVDIPDVNFKNELLISSDTYPNRLARDLNDNFIAVDANNDGEIQNSEAENISYLYIPNLNIISLQGIEAFINLEYLSCDNNQLSTLDLSALTNLKELQANNNNIVSIDFSSNPNLEDILMESNQLTTIDVSNLHNLDFVSFNYNQITSLFIKTGSEPHVVFVQNPVEYVCTEDSRVAHYEQYLENFVGCTDCYVNSYCSFTPGGSFFSIEGETKLDLDANGCDMGDNLYPNLKLNIDNGTFQDFVVADNSGYFNLSLQEGTYNIEPELEGVNYFTITPSSIVVNFPMDGASFNQDFCIVPDGIHNDLEISIIPLEEARPGFETDYKIIYKNKGNTMLSGSIDFQFDDNYMDVFTVVPAANSQSSGNLSWNYNDLLPFETGEIFITMTLNTPTDGDFPLDGGDILDFIVTINPVVSDETVDDNTTALSQQVVNSFDPNDKTCLEGFAIAIDDVGKYLHYLIRFENTGTASAVNVVVKDVIDTSKFDVASIIPVDASHNYFLRNQNGNVTEFIFENINLPFDDANNDGYILFKIKTLETLEVGDLLNNNAEIYFDFNAPIITNTAFTEVVEPLSVKEFDNRLVKLFPNPTEEELQISSDIIIDTIFMIDINGRVLKRIEVSKTSHSLDVSSLSNGIYFLEIQSGDFISTRKFIKN